MKFLLLLASIFLYTFVNGQIINDTININELKNKPNSLPNETITIIDDFHFYLDSIPVIKLPNELRIDNLQGKAIVGVWIDTNSTVEWHALLFLSLKSKYECFIIYRATQIKSFSYDNRKNINIESYPLPIQPYVVYFKEKINALKFKENTKVNKANIHFSIPFRIE